MLAQFPIARAFGVDACGAVLCSGDRAPRHYQAATRLVARSIGRCTDGRGGFAQGGKQQPAAGRGGVGLPAEESTGDATAILGWPVRPVRPALSARRRPRHTKTAPHARRSRRGVAVSKGLDCSGHRCRSSAAERQRDGGQLLEYVLLLSFRVLALAALGLVGGRLPTPVPYARTSDRRSAGLRRAVSRPSNRSRPRGRHRLRPARGSGC